MSERHPIIAITGSSGAGTSTVTRTFQNIFRREEVKAAVIEGDSFHRFDRKAMKARMADEEAQGNRHFSHFGAEGNLFDKIEELFKTYGEKGTGKKRYYLHSDEEAADHNKRLGTGLTGFRARLEPCGQTGRHPARSGRQAGALPRQGR